MIDFKSQHTFSSSTFNYATFGRVIERVQVLFLTIRPLEDISGPNRVASSIIMLQRCFRHGMYGKAFITSKMVTED